MRTTEILPEVLRLAVQKGSSDGGSIQGKARLGEPTQDLMHRAGLDFDFPGRSMECSVQDSSGVYPVVIFGRPNRELVRFGAGNNADAVIVGADRFFDMASRDKGYMDLVIPLDIAVCWYQLGAYQESEFAHLTDAEGQPRLTTLADVAGQRIATAHSNALKLLADMQEVKLKIDPVIGGVEGSYYKNGRKYPVIADITSSGMTMRENGYDPQAVLFESSGMLIARRDLSPVKVAILADLIDRLLSAQGDEATRIANARAETWRPMIDALENSTLLRRRVFSGVSLSPDDSELIAVAS